LQNTTKGFGSGKISKEEVGEKRRAREEKGPEKRRGQRREGAREKKGTEKKRDWRRKGTGEGKGLLVASEFAPCGSPRFLNTVQGLGVL
jgi:hypothetical protein